MYIYTMYTNVVSATCTYTHAIHEARTTGGHGNAASPAVGRRSDGAHTPRGEGGRQGVGERVERRRHHGAGVVLWRDHE